MIASLPQPDEMVALVAYLATDEAANINGCTFLISGDQIALYTDPIPAKTIYKDGPWTVDELTAIVPSTLAAGLMNPAPPQAPKQ